MNTELRIFFRIIGETVKGIKRARWMTLAVILSMAAILSIFASLLRTSLFISHFVEEIGRSFEVSVYLKPGKDPKHAQNELSKYKNITDITIKTKEDAWKEFKEQMGFSGTDNPLPDTIRIKLKDKTNVKDFIISVKNLNFTEDVFYAGEIADKVSKIGNHINIAATIVVIALVFLTFVIINNTVYLAIESHKKEIEIMRIMGVSDWYIKAPYVFQGVFYGACGAAFAFIPLFVVDSCLNNVAVVSYVPIDPMNTRIVMLVVFLMGIIVGSVGSMLSVKKYLQV